MIPRWRRSPGFQAAVTRECALLRAPWGSDALVMAHRQMVQSATSLRTSRRWVLGAAIIQLEAGDQTAREAFIGSIQGMDAKAAQTPAL